MMSDPPNLRQRMLPGRHSVSASWWLSTRMEVRSIGAVQHAVCELAGPTVCSVVAEVPQVDHRVDQGLEGIVDIGDDLVANENAPEFVLPSEDALDGAKALFEDGITEHTFGSTLGGFSAARVLVDVRNHVAVEDRFAVGFAIVDPVEADGAPSKIDANGTGDARQLRQCLTQQRRLVAIARGCDEWRDHIAVAVAKRDDFVAPLLGDGCGAVAVNDRGVKQVAFEKGLHRTREDGVDAAVGHPAAKRTVDSRVVDFGSPIAARLNRQRLPLTPQVELQQDVVEDLVQRQFDVRPPASTREVRQDKFIKLLETQIRWNPLPLLALRHFARQSRRILPEAAGFHEPSVYAPWQPIQTFGKPATS